MTGTTPVILTNPQITTETPFNIYFESEPVGNITKTLASGTLTIVSDNVLDTMAFRVVMFGFGSVTTYISSEVETLNGV
jgi:hypothetical protein